jgi:hypothetical protein
MGCKYCENCKKKEAVKTGEYSSDKFCSKKCAIAFGRRNFDKKKKKVINCTGCKKTIEVSVFCSEKRCLCEECRQKYTWKGSTCKICGANNCNREHFFCQHPGKRNLLIKMFGFDKSKLNSLEALKEFDKIKEVIEYKYLSQKMSSIEIGKEFGFKFPDTFWKIMRFFNIPRRSWSEARMEAIIQDKIHFYDGNPRYKQGWHTTWNGKRIYYRSGYELDYAKKLDEEKVNYEVEKIRITYWDSELKKTRVAIADFYFPEQNLIVEIKSNFTFKVKEMYDKVREYINYGYKFKLIIDFVERDFEWIKSQLDNETKIS